MELSSPPALVSERHRRAVIWHDLECGGYSADLPLWLELAGEPREDEPILEVGSGTGRVSLELARRGHRVSAVDNDPALLQALEERRGSLPVTTVLADARALELEYRDFALCLIPMQTLQLFGGARGRLDFFAHARAHLRAGGVLACAVATRLESFDRAAGAITPKPDIARAGGELYCSEVLSVRSGRRGTRIERLRTIAAPGAGASGRPRERERHVIELDPVSASALEREARSAGLTPAGHREIPETDEYAASLLLSFHA